MKFQSVSILATILLLVGNLASANQPLSDLGAKILWNLSGGKTKVRDTNDGGGNNDQTSLQKGGNCWAFGGAAVYMAKYAADYAKKNGETLTPKEFAKRWVAAKNSMVKYLGRSRNQNGGSLQEGRQWLLSKGMHPGQIHGGAPTDRDFRGTVALDISYSGGNAGGHIIAGYSYLMAKKMGLLDKKAPPKPPGPEADPNDPITLQDLDAETDRYTGTPHNPELGGRGEESPATHKPITTAYLIDSSKQSGIFEVRFDGRKKADMVYGMFDYGPRRQGQRSKRRFEGVTINQFFNSVNPGGFFSVKN